MSQPKSIAVHRSPNKLWRSNSIFNLCHQQLDANMSMNTSNGTGNIRETSNSEKSATAQCRKLQQGRQQQRAGNVREASNSKRRQQQKETPVKAVALVTVKHQQQKGGQHMEVTQTTGNTSATAGSTAVETPSATGRPAKQ
jgi:hypothetical protein